MSFFTRKRTDHFREKRKNEFLWQVVRGIGKLAIVGILLGVSWYVTRLPTFTITEVSIEGGETIAHDVIREHVRTELTGSYFLIVPKQFSYLYPHDRIVEVLEKVPRVYNVAVVRESKTALRVSFDEYIPHALWCTEPGGEASCWFINETGYAFTKAPTLQGGALARHVTEKGEEIEEGQVIGEEQLRAVNLFIARTASELGFRISKILYRENSDIEFSVSGGGTIFVSGNKNFETTFENLRVVLNSPEFDHLAPGNFKYIDVRFDNKVFVNEELEADSAIESATTTLPE